jgi:hypothetical protein
MAKTVIEVPKTKHVVPFVLRAGEVEVLAIVCDKEQASKVTTEQLFELQTHFHRQLCFIVSKDELRIFSFDDQTTNRLMALLPFMTHFRCQRIVVSKKKKDEYLLKQSPHLLR